MSELYSYHIFVFPFKWDIISSQGDTQTLMENFTTLGNQINANPKWNEASYSFDKNYNEHIYLRQEVSKILFSDNNKGIVQNYLYEIGNDKDFTIGIKDFSEVGKVDLITLTIEKITLDVFANGVGLLSFFLENNNYKSDKHILYINEYGRRIFPQFVFENSSDSTAAKDTFLADKIKVMEFDDDFAKFKQPNFIPNYILKILGGGFSYDSNSNTDNILISRINDDRMHVLSWKRELALENDTIEKYKFAESPDWYKYVFIDKKEPSVKNHSFQKRLLENANYTRWLEDGQLFGISRYSFVICTSNDNNWLVNQLKGNYFRLVELVLLQKISLVRFSEETAQISLLQSPKEALKRATQLYGQYTQFISKMYHTEASFQDQGIELYNMLRSTMNIDNQRVELEKEIEALHSYIYFISEKEKNEIENNKNNAMRALTQRFTYISIAFLAISFMFGFLGMSCFDKNNFYTIGLRSLFIFGLLTFVLSRYFWQSVGSESNNSEEVN